MTVVRNERKMEREDRRGRERGEREREKAGKHKSYMVSKLTSKESQTTSVVGRSKRSYLPQHASN